MELVPRLQLLSDTLHRYVAGVPLIVMILAAGVYLTWRTGFLQVRRFGFIARNTLGRLTEGYGRTARQTRRGDISPFQALTTALAATIGTGNIAGVATALTLGGPGAIFWMWLSAFLGMATKYSEVVLAVEYRETRGQTVAGGPMYFLRRGLKAPVLAGAFATFGFLAALGSGNMVQANSVAGAVAATFGVAPLVTGLALATLVALVIVGGLKRIGSVTEKLVPLMALFYATGALFVVGTHLSLVPAAFAAIFRGAFTGTAAAGGFAGAAVTSAIRFGVARGIFTNEAGLGSASIAHASARTDHPSRQGMWGVMEVFIDTHVVCTITALVLLVTGAWLVPGVDGAAMTAEAFNRGLPGPGGVIVAIGIILFAFTTLVTWSFYGEKCFEYLFGAHTVTIYRLVWLPVIVLGAVGGLRQVWALADILNALMALPNLAGLILLAPVVSHRTREFFAQR
ncbi:MAG: sodium:alanine symporter family protein [Bacillota bacterium]